MATKTPTANPEYALTDLYLYLVDSCNLACGHCWIEPRTSATDGRSIPLDPLKAAIEEARSLGLQRVTLTGGEPLLSPDLNDLPAFIAESNLECHLETNGTLLDRKTVRALSAAGIEQVSVSLDAASPKLHDELRGVAGSFDRTVAGIGRLAEQGIRPEIIMTVGRLNRREVPRLMHLVEDLGATSLKINPLIPCGRAKAAFSKGLNLDLDELMELHELTETIRHGMDGLEAYLDLPPAFLAM